MGVIDFLITLIFRDFIDFFFQILDKGLMWCDFIVIEDCNVVVSLGVFISLSGNFEVKVCE